MKVTLKSVFLVFLMSLLIAPAAFAGLTAVGPPNAITGFPEYYMDAKGVTAWLPNPPFGTPGEPLVPVSPTMAFDEVNLAAPFSATVGFGTEAAYYSTEALIESPLGRIRYVAALEATFANVPPVAVNGQQAVFARIRCIFREAPVPGVYTLQHPYGTESFIVTATDVANKKGIKFTRDIPAAVALDFTSALSGDVGPFLRQVQPIRIDPGTPAPFDNPTLWLGDGVTLSEVSGSPTGFNKVRLTAPLGVNLDGAGNNFIETSLFVTSGVSYAQVGPAPPPPVETPLTVDSATFTRTKDVMTYNIFATAPAGSTVTVDIAGSVYNLVGDANGKFFLSQPLPRAQPTVRPETVTVTAEAVGMTPTSITAPMTDQVIITQAVYNTRKARLKITASSSDQRAKATLTITSPPLGVMGNGGSLTKTYTVTTPPAKVVIGSSLGGTGTASVSVVFK